MSPEPQRAIARSRTDPFLEKVCDLHAADLVEAHRERAEDLVDNLWARTRISIQDRVSERIQSAHILRRQALDNVLIGSLLELRQTHFVRKAVDRLGGTRTHGLQAGARSSGRGARLVWRMMSEQERPSGRPWEGLVARGREVPSRVIARGERSELDRVRIEIVEKAAESRIAVGIDRQPSAYRTSSDGSRLTPHR